MRGRVIKIDVATKEKRRRIAGRDVMVTVEPGAAEFTTSGGNKRQVRQGETICVQGENISLASAGGDPRPLAWGVVVGCVARNTPVVIYRARRTEPSPYVLGAYVAEPLLR